jgi:hypothetical protein
LINELFSNGKGRGPGPHVCGPAGRAQSTVDRRRRGQRWERCGELQAWCSPFIGVGGAPGRGGRGVNADVNGFNAIEDGGGFKRGIKGGKMKARW